MGATPTAVFTAPLRRALILTLCVLALVVGLVGTSAQPASAAAPRETAVDMTQACRDRWGGYQYTARAYDGGNPYSWVCGYETRTSTFSATGPIPGGAWAIQWMPVGGVDVAAYCRDRQSNARAVLIAWNAWGWRCRG